MEDFFGIVEAFYARFILRDLLAKITPGSIVLLAMAKNIAINDVLISLISNFSFVFGVLIISISWIVGFGIQGLGEKLKLIKYHENEEAQENYSKFLKYGDKDQQKDVERVVVIKETCGNSYIALIIMFIINLCYMVMDENYVSLKEILFKNFPNLIILIILIYSLRYMHFEHVKRQNKVVINKLEIIN